MCNIFFTFKQDTNITLQQKVSSKSQLSETSLSSLAAWRRLLMDCNILMKQEN